MANMTFGVNLIPHNNAPTGSNNYSLGNSNYRWKIYANTINDLSIDNYINPSVMTGATENANGVAGLVPAPTSADAGKFLRGDGTWGNAAGGEQVVIIPVTYSSGRYNMTYTYNEIKSLIVANKIVILSYGEEFYYQRHSNIIQESATPYLYFYNPSVANGTQSYFYIYLSGGSTNIRAGTQTHSVYVNPFLYYYLVQDENNNYYISNYDYYSLDDLAQDTEQFSIMSGSDETIILEKTGESLSSGYSNYRKYYFNKVYFEDVEDDENGQYTIQYIEYIGIIEINNTRVLRKILISGQPGWWAGVTVVVTDSSLGGNANLPTPAEIGAIAAPTSPTTGSFLVWNGSTWAAQTLATWQGGNY